MELERAHHQLLGHAFLLEDLGDPAMKNSLCQSLRPYQGLRRDPCADVQTCVTAIASQLQEPQLDRELIAALWTIGWTTRNWALHPEGMLGRNNLISPHDRAWLDD